MGSEGSSVKLVLQGVSRAVQGALQCQCSAVEAQCRAVQELHSSAGQCRCKCSAKCRCSEPARKVSRVEERLVLLQILG